MGVWLDRGDLWKSARVLQLRFRYRLRVAVDAHCCRPAIFSPDGYFSSTVQRLVTRFRDFRRETLPSSTAFCRRRVSKELCEEEESAIVRMLQYVAVPLLGNACHVFMNGLNSVQVYGLEKLHDALLNRPKNKPLITVSNHVASVDDPFVIASLLPPKILLDSHNLRWTLCATDRCFKNPMASAFFRSVKVLPVSRGEGIYQKGMDMAITKLNHGGWVHIFPEGSRSRDGGKTIGSAKRGIGRLVLDADSLPMVVPFVHTGMQDIMPIGANLPRIGKTVTVLVGDPIVFDDLLNAEGAKKVSRKKLYDAVASRVGQRLREMKLQVDKLAHEQSVQLLNYAKQRAEEVVEIIHHIDWDSFSTTILTRDDSRRLGSTEGSGVNTINAPQENVDLDCRDVRAGPSYESGLAWRIRSYMGSTELIGFAARGLLLRDRGVETRVGIEKLGPLRAWREFLEANLLTQWNTC